MNMKNSVNENVDLHSLKVFCKVVENKSFTRAAKELFLSQPTISAHISKLEKSFKTRFLDRRGSEIIPTKAGIILFEYGCKILKIKGEMVQSINGFLGNISGELSLGASTIPGEYIIPEFIGRFKSAYPGVKANVAIADSAKVTEMVSSGRVEVGIVGNQPEKLISEYLDNDNLILIVPPKHSFAEKGKNSKTGAEKAQIDLRQLKNEPFIMREAGSGTRKAMETGLKKAGFNLKDLKIACELGSTGAVKKAVMESMGISIISDKAVKYEVQFGLLNTVKVKGLNIKRAFHLIYNPKISLSPIARSFIQFIKERKNPEIT